MSQPRVLWVEQRHSNLEYYDALRHALVQRGINIIDLQHKQGIASALPQLDVVLLGFGWMSGEPPLTRDIRPLPEFSQYCALPKRNVTDFARTGALVHARPPATTAADSRCLCGSVPLFVLLNKEYCLMPQKLRWLSEHCVAAAFSVHHDVASFEAATGVPFFRISFGANVERFGGGARASDAAESARIGGPLTASAAAAAVTHSPSTAFELGREQPQDITRNVFSRARLTRLASASASASALTTAGGEKVVSQVGEASRRGLGQSGGQRYYEYDLGFTGVVRKDQTSNWRYRIWKQSWPLLQTRGVRLYAGEKGGVHVGVRCSEQRA